MVYVGNKSLDAHVVRKLHSQETVGVFFMPEIIPLPSVPCGGQSRMADASGNYLKQHIWNILQCVLGLGCFVLEWLAYRASQFSGRANPPYQGTPMTPHYAMPWYLWTGITALVLSVIIPAILRMLSRKRLPSSTHGSEESAKELVMFTPLQIEAIKLSKDLMDFVSNFEPLPEYEKGNTNALGARLKWRERLQASYQLKFEEREMNILLKFQQNNIRPNFPEAIRRIQKLEELIPINAANYVAMAHQLDGLELRVRDP
jgi:hypothetical protein